MAAVVHAAAVCCPTAPTQSVAGSSSLALPVWPSTRASRRVSARRAGPQAAAAVEAVPASEPQRTAAGGGDANQPSREGSYEAPLVTQQASKDDPEQPTLASALPAFDITATADVAVVGAGPAGLAAAAELAKQGLSVAMVSPESKFVNNYGVWLDEFKDLGLESTLDAGGCSRARG